MTEPAYIGELYYAAADGTVHLEVGCGEAPALLAPLEAPTLPDGALVVTAADAGVAVSSDDRTAAAAGAAAAAILGAMQPNATAAQLDNVRGKARAAALETLKSLGMGGKP